jgi:hypothetical protein
VGNEAYLGVLNLSTLQLSVRRVPQISDWTEMACDTTTYALMPLLPSFSSSHDALCTTGATPSTLITTKLWQLTLHLLEHPSSQRVPLLSPVPFPVSLSSNLSPLIQTAEISFCSYSDDFYGLTEDAYAFDQKARVIYAVLDHKVQNTHLLSHAMDFSLVDFSFCCRFTAKC